jgi:uncharacterized protein YecT (DUF1311 family)
VDEAVLLECVQSLEKGIDFSQIDTTALQCAHIESQRCMKVIGENYPTSIAQGHCERAELAAWRRLLKQVYRAQVSVLARADDSWKSSRPEELLAPSFMRAHKAWEEFTEAECQFLQATVSRGTARFYMYDSCALDRTAGRVFLYRRPLLP